MEFVGSIYCVSGCGMCGMHLVYVWWLCVAFLWLYLWNLCVICEESVEYKFTVCCSFIFGMACVCVVCVLFLVFWGFWGEILTFQIDVFVFYCL